MCVFTKVMNRYEENSLAGRRWEEEMAEYTITLVKEKRSFTSEETATLLDALIHAGAAPDAPCGGHGTCGKCLVDRKSTRLNSSHRL